MPCVASHRRFRPAYIGAGTRVEGCAAESRLIAMPLVPEALAEKLREMIGSAERPSGRYYD